MSDAMRAATSNGEQPDAIGWRSGNVSIVIECKASRSDFLADHRKHHRRAGTSCGDWRFFLAPPNTIKEAELPAGWGLLEVHGRTIRKTTGVPGNAHWALHKPFEGNKRVEMEIMYSALRRLRQWGVLDRVYEPPSLNRVHGR